MIGGVCQNRFLLPIAAANMPTPKLTALCDWDVEESITLTIAQSELGDSYSQTVAGSVLVDRRWQLRSWQTNELQLSSILANLRQFQGDQSFNWSPDDGDTVALAPYYCHEWSVSTYAPNVFCIEGELFNDPSGECEIFRNDLDEATIVAQMTGAIAWFQTYTRSTAPLICNPQGVSTNSFHNVLGRGGYLPPSTGTTEGQAAIIRSLLLAWKTPQLPAAAKSSALSQATLMASALEPYFYGTPVPSVPTAQVWLPHWVINARGSFVSKGSQSPSDFMNFGYFDVPVTFTGGVGTVPGGLIADLYKVYSVGGKLLWRNVTSPLVSGFEYAVSYWVSNLQLQGQNYRFTVNYQSPGGGTPIATTEPAGKIVLTTSFTGTLWLTYSAYDGATIAVNQRFDAFPMWRPLQSGEINHAFDVSWWIDESFELLAQATGLAKWQRARDANKYSTITTGTILNESYLFRRDTTTNDPFGYPGTGYVVVNNSAPSSVVRATDGGVQLNMGDGLELYPSLELQNFAIAVSVVTGTIYRTQVACSVANWIEVVVSLAKNLSDFTQEYTAWINCPAGLADYTQVDVLPKNFAKWTNETWWHSTNVDNPVYSYQGGGGSATITKQLDAIDDGQRLATRIQMSLGSGFVGAGFVLSTATNQPPTIYYRTTSAVRLRCQDLAGAWYSWTLPPSPTYTTFTPIWTNAADGNVQAVDLVPLGASADIMVYWLGSPPLVLPVPCNAYKHVIRSRIDTAYSIKVGDWQALNSPLNAIKYNPGAVPFTVNSIGGTIDAWRGSLYVGYQNPATWYKWGRADLAATVLQCLMDSQSDYGRRSPGGATGLFSPVYYWPVWSEGVFGEYNTWGWNGADPNTEWGQYTYRALEATAKCWHLGKGDSSIARPAQRITMNALRYLDKFIRANNRPPTNIKSNIAPQALYDDPAAAALILRAAIWANLAGGDRALTFRVIRRCWVYLQSQYVGAGLMAGSYSNGQPTFNEAGQTYKEYFGFWQAEILEALSLMAQYRALLNLPPCSTLI